MKLERRIHSIHGSHAIVSKPDSSGVEQGTIVVDENGFLKFVSTLQTEGEEGKDGSEATG